MKLTKSQLMKLIKEEVMKEGHGTPDETPYMDFTKYELEDMSTDRQMIILLEEIVAQLKTLNHTITPAKVRSASGLEKYIAQAQVAEEKEIEGN